MASAQLSATARDGRGKGSARTLRAEGKIPAVIYGHGRDPLSLAIDTRELEKLLSKISAESTVIELSMGGTLARTLIREIQRHPFKRQILHVDFQELVAGEKVTVRIPLVLVGIPEGVRQDGGILDQTMRELEVEVDPANIPNHVDIEVTSLRIGDSVHVRDIKLPEGVEPTDEGDATICVVSAPRAAIEATPVAEGAEVEAAPEPEVIGKKKEEEEEEGE
ncbi:MAG TPA: 50S ribosomal protein L25/general stress protein Ctc [Gemmatimonadaceae bacterium]|jgi:large subunit ribosomal protein L25|nr:50S ribosomal protein L25/general stress protein Ctc [Gemmatimonadaceae bacterium]